MKNLTTTTLSALLIILCLASVSVAKTLYFPHIASDSSWETEICLINASNIHNLNGFLTTYNDSGLQLNTTSIMLAPDAREEIIVGNELASPSQIGYIIFESDSAAVIGYTKFYINSTYRVAVPATAQVNDSEIVIPHIASDAKWWTGISLLNTTDTNKELTIEFSNGTTKSRTIASKEHQVFTIKQLFDNLSQPSINSAIIKNGEGLVGLELFGSNGGFNENSLSGVLLKVDTTGSIYYPHIANDATWWTGIVAYNPSPSSCNLAITPYQQDGTMLNPQALQIAGKQKYTGSANSLNLPEASAWLKIEASQPITGFELFGALSGNQLAGYTAVGISGSNGIFPKLEKVGWTGIAFVNIGASSANVTITAYDNRGAAIAVENIALSGHEKIVSDATSLFSADISAATYLKYSSTNDIVGFQMNGSGDGAMLDALPADNSGITVNELLTSATIDGQGGTLAAGGFSLNIPAGTFNTAVDLKLYKTGTHASFAQGVVTDSFRVTGLPDDFPETLLPDLQLTGTLSGESFIVVGEEVLISSKITPTMAYHLLPANSNSGLLASLPRTAAANTPIFAKDAPLRTNSSNTSISLDFFGITGWATYNANENLRTNGSQSHFLIRYAPFFVSRADLNPLFQYLEEAYSTYENMGFSYEGRSSWPITVTVMNLAADTYGYFCKSIWGNNWSSLQFNQNKLGSLPELRNTAGHEFFHFIQYLYDSRISYSRQNPNNAFTLSLHWLNEATAVWAEEKFTDTPNYVSSIRNDCEIAPFNGMEAGTQGNIDDAGEHGYGMSALIKYLVSRYGESIVRDIYLKILDQQHPVRAIELAINPNFLFMAWEPFLREYVQGNIYNVPKAPFLNATSGIFRIRSNTDLAKTFTETYPDLSAKLFTIGLNYPNISPAKAINFTIDQDVCDITLFKVKSYGTLIEYMSHSSTKELKQKDLRSLTDDKYNLLVMVTNSNYFNTPQIYTNSKQIKLDILVESIAAAMTLSASTNTVDADGVSTSTITATVTDEIGDPVEGETVTFTTDSGGLSAGTADTNANGIATVNYIAPGTAPPSGTSTITATTTNAITETIVITVNTSPSWTGWPDPKWCPKIGTGDYQWGGTLAIYPPNNPDQAIQCTYWGNAQLRWEIPNLSGKHEGWWKSYFESGALKSETPYKAGKREGTGTWFYESGNISSQAPYVNDLLEGNYIEYHEDGLIISVIPHQSDLRNGMAHFFYSTGERWKDEPWQNDLRHGITKGYYKSGPLNYEHPYTNGKKNGMTKGYYENGNRKYETPYTDGKKNGTSKEYYEIIDQLKLETPYTDDIIDGTQFRYYATGELNRETPYVDGLKHGLEKYYYTNGQISSSTTYQDGVMHGQEKEYAEDGEMTSCKTYDNGTYVGSCMP